MNATTLISQQNDLTLSFLKDGDFSGAIKSSVCALKHQMDIVAKSPSNSSSEEATSGGCVDDHMVLLEEDDAKKKASSSNPPPQSSIYRHPIPFPSKLSSPAVVSSILIFNAALTYHLSALSPSGNSKLTAVEALQKAKRLYEQIQASFYLEDMPLNENGLFHFAVTNNLAAVYRDLGDTATSNSLFDYLITYRLGNQV